MSDIASAATVYRPLPGHSPRSRQDSYKRVHLYVSQMGAAASAELKQALLLLREAAAQLPDEQLQAAARRMHSQSEIAAAAKELLCAWIHLEAIDQGGESMPRWLAEFLRLALHATDFLIAEPAAVEVMNSHAECAQMPALVLEVSAAIGARLGLGPVSPTLAPVFAPLLENSRVVRQKILRHTLTIDQMQL